VPLNSAGSPTSAKPPSTAGRMIAWPIWASGGGSEPGMPGVSAVQTTSTAARPATSEKTSSGLVTWAAAPSTGPSATPATAAASTAPTMPPRWPLPAARITHASPPAHEHGAQADRRSGEHRSENLH
jgi:hypothetical protein